MNPLPAAHLPPDILTEIAWCVAGAWDLLNLCLASHGIYALLIPVLYTSVECNVLVRCNERVAFFLRRPHLARCVRKLILRTHSRLYFSDIPPARKDDAELTRAVELLLPNLHNLLSFDWDGVEMPNDKLWLALRASCPRLKHVGVIIGNRDLPRDSELFSFSGLLSFTFGYSFNKEQLSGNVVLKLPDRLWTMLLTRCPDLEVLYLGGTSSSQPCRFDLRPLTQGKWPKLHSLTICKALIIEGATGSGLNSKDLSPFLSSHPALKKLRVVWPSREPLIGFTGSSIALDSYWGSVLGITDVASSSCNLKELTLMDSEGYTSGQIHLIRAALRLLPSLSSLSIWLDFSHRIFNDRSEGYECDHIKSVRSILACCPELLHFKFTCTTTPHKTFPMKRFGQALLNSPKLRTLHVCKYRWGDEPMIESANRITHQVPSLKQITFHYRAIRLSIGSRSKMGTYSVQKSSNDQHTRLVAEETKISHRPLTHRPKVTFHRYMHERNPPPTNRQVLKSLEIFGEI